MSSEQLLLVAREFCQAYRVRVINFAALAAAAAASTATVEGIAVHASRSAAAESLETVLSAVPALSGKNEDFARFCAEVYLSVAEVM